MRRLFHRCKRMGQSTAEYAIVIALVIAAVTAMQVYVKRSLQGGVKFSVDKLSASEQYEPYYSASSYQTSTEQYTETEETLKGGEVKRDLASEAAAKQTKRFGRSFIRAPKEQD